MTLTLIFAGLWALMAVAGQPMIKSRPARDPLRLAYGGAMLGLVAATVISAVVWVI